MARAPQRPAGRGWARLTIRLPPPLLLGLLYIVLAVAGAAILHLPFAQRMPGSFGDTFFTAVSAVTLTGLSVVDISSRFTMAGQAILLVLIQLGGIGVMTVTILVLVALGAQINLGQQHMLREDLDRTDLRDLLGFVRSIAVVVLVCEAIGMILLATAFVPILGTRQGLWHALFYAVSGFNNAGFSLYSDSMARFALNWPIAVILPLLWIIGGLGYSVIIELVRVRSWSGLSLHTRIMLAGSLGLTIWGFAAFCILEWTNPETLGSYFRVSDRLLLAWFQSVAPRSSGFSTLDPARMHDATAILQMSLMVIGAGPASTGGGLKVTAVVVLLLATIAFFRRRTEASIFGRTLDTELVMKVLALTVISMILLLTGTFLLSATHDHDFIDILFESVSALNTVGLSRGITGDLNGWGRACVIAMMLVGRIGPLTLGYLLATRAPPRVRYPKGTVYIG
jgi:trk system potassium uptake protein TrkH